MSSPSLSRKRGVHPSPPSSSSDATSSPPPPAMAMVPSSPSSLKVLFLSSDTGGGHRASAEALAAQFLRLFPGSAYHILDIMTDHGPPPYNALKGWYKHLSAHPNQWNIVYKVSNTTAYSTVQDIHMKLASERAVRKRIQSLEPDVVVSVHPLMNSVPALACRRISSESGKHLPMFTVVTDLGSAHCSWFDRNVEKLFIASESVRTLAIQRGKVPPERIVQTGLPIRNEFAVQAKRLRDRTTAEGKTYMKLVRQELHLCDDDVDNHSIILIMGGGEGVGSLSAIVDSVYATLVRNGTIHATILVVCGRNETLKTQLENRDWNAVITAAIEAEEKKRFGVRLARRLQRLLSKSDLEALAAANTPGERFKIVTGIGKGGSNNGKGETPKHKSGKNMLIEGEKVKGQTKERKDPPSLGEQKIHSINDAVQLAESSSSSYDEGDDPNAPESIEMTAYAPGNMETPRSTPTDTPMLQKTPPQQRQQHDQEESQLQQQQHTQQDSSSIPSELSPKVTVRPLGYTTQMASYMTASTVLLTKAGPGTIAEAAALGLPVILTSFLPGQEEGNVDFVVQYGFGAYVPDTEPERIAKTVLEWLRPSSIVGGTNNVEKEEEEKTKSKNDTNEKKETTKTEEENVLAVMSRKAREVGKPDAAEDIVQCIGTSALRWKELNEHHVIDEKREGSGGDVVEKDEQDKNVPRKHPKLREVVTGKEVEDDLVDQDGDHHMAHDGD